MPTPPTLSVYAVPYIALDHEGRPAGAFPHEPQFLGGLPADVAVRHVGAVRTVGKELRKAQGNLTAHHEHLFDFGDAPEPVLVENTDYYRRAIKQRELIAADVESWIAAGCERQTFVDPRLALLWARDGAQAKHVAHYGEESPHVARHWADHHKVTADALAQKREEAAAKARAAQPILDAKAAADAGAKAPTTTSKQTPPSPTTETK